MPDIFLSYNRDDQVVAQRFAMAFEAQGYSVWWDVTLRSGEAYDTVTEEALKTAKAVVVLWSKTSVVSRWVRAEATVADRNRTLVPATIEPCDRPIMFELTQTADLSHWAGEPGDPAWRSFLADVGRFVETGKEPVLPAAPAPAKPGRRDTRPSIAILPFINRSGIGEDDIFADGIVEDLTAALSLGRKVKVVAASATAAYRTGARDFRRIGQDLGVRFLLEGNVRRVGVDLRVTAQLVEAESGDIQWTRKFDRPLAELGALEEELVTEVAAHLGVAVERAEMELALRKPDDITAWEAVLRAEANYGLNTWSGNEAAIAEGRRAIEIDPECAAAHAILATGLAQRKVFIAGSDWDLESEVLESVARAHALEPDNAFVLAWTAGALQVIGKSWDALPLAQRAVAISPHNENARLSLGFVLLSLDRPDEAIAELEAAERISPDSVWTTTMLNLRAFAQFHAGRFEVALELADRWQLLSPSTPAQILYLLCLAKLDRYDDAREALRRLRDANPGMTSEITGNHIRNISYLGISPAQFDEYAAILRELWG